MVDDGVGGGMGHRSGEREHAGLEEASFLDEPVRVKAGHRHGHFPVGIAQEEKAAVKTLPDREIAALREQRLHGNLIVLPGGIQVLNAHHDRLVEAHRIFEGVVLEILHQYRGLSAACVPVILEALLGTIEKIQNRPGGIDMGRGAFIE